MFKLFKQKAPTQPPPEYLVRIQHVDMEDVAIEGLWFEMYKGHYHLKATSVVVGDGKGQTTTSSYRVDEIMVPERKVAFLEIIAKNEALPVPE